ncbi:hypothetical protein QN391_00570 [Pseudomonas sp. CCI1.2]|uniref:hypothetical protein n=1 Tax=unclassified Pseudomonas TaxID=196821 RepID=UPI002AC9D723|nr:MULTISPECIES: hypothetical protein [unclassified Pseudomonas]MEB0091782.1 hypothetical protein [Pseudomonas sp. CCI4.2]MEB0119200.1 hypothetical protein [Pseudomonas sp. CCI1.2]WPX54865.1 hypothetical protein RHM65_04615 [Pseudomonas sp. CCI4.2]
MAADNIDRFNRLTGSVFGRLYSSFPMPIDLEVMDFAGAVVRSGDPDQEDQMDNAREFFRSTLTWLSESGYMTHTASTSDIARFYGCTLTAKALEVLKSTPSSVGGETLGGKLASAAKDGATSKLKDLAGEALSKGYDLASRTAMAWIASQ